MLCRGVIARAPVSNIIIPSTRCSRTSSSWLFSLALTSHRICSRGRSGGCSGSWRLRVGHKKRLQSDNTATIQHKHNAAATRTEEHARALKEKMAGTSGQPNMSSDVFCLFILSIYRERERDNKWVLTLNQDGGVVGWLRGYRGWLVIKRWRDITYTVGVGCTWVGVGADIPALVPSSRRAQTTAGIAGGHLIGRVTRSMRWAPADSIAKGLHPTPR